MDIKNFINDSRLKGMSDNAIKSALLNMGAAPAEVNAALPAFVQPQPRPEIVVPQEVQPQVAAPREAEPSATPAQQIQPHITTAQEIQPQVAASQEVQPKIALAQPTQGEADLSRIIKEAQAKTDAISSTKPQTAEPVGTKETIMQNVGTFGTQPITPSGGMPAVNTVFGNQPAVNIAQTLPETALPVGGKKKGAVIVGILVATILIGGLAYAYTQKLLFFALSSEPLPPADITTETLPPAPEVAPAISTSTGTSIEGAQLTTTSIELSPPAQAPTSTTDIKTP